MTERSDVITLKRTFDAPYDYQHAEIQGRLEAFRDHEAVFSTGLIGPVAVEAYYGLRKAAIYGRALLHGALHVERID